MMTAGAISARRGAPVFVLAGSVLFLLASALVSGALLKERSLADLEGGRGSRNGDLLLRVSRQPFFAFGFRNFLADVAWLGAVQAAGPRRMTRGEYDSLAVHIETVNNFDPKFLVPYLLGGLVLADSPAHVPAALRTLERGRESLPSEWRIPFYMGYLKYFLLGNPVDAGRDIETAGRIPGSPSYLPLLAARMLAEGRQPETALSLLEAMLRQETDPARVKTLQARIADVTVERDIQALERAVALYRQKSGRAPQSLDDIVSAGILRKIPAEPSGGRYILSGDGTVRSDRVTRRYKVFRRS